VKALPKGTKRLAAEEPLPFTGHDEANFIDGVISTCYRLVGSFEQEIRIDQVTRCVPRGTLGEIADKAFALAWNTRDLTCIQQAQILDILLSVSPVYWMRQKVDYRMRSIKAKKSANRPKRAELRESSPGNAIYNNLHSGTQHEGPACDISSRISCRPRGMPEILRVLSNSP
jgi:hypothetical protein